MLQNGLKFKDFDEITNKTQHKPFLEKFQNYLKIWTPKHPKILFLLHF